jgi:isoquinoline 1-oxidoreductase alpha subunit
VDGAAVRSCARPLSAIDGHTVVTIEGLAKGETLHPVQQAWIEEDVAQCGYCQAGQVMAAAALLARTPDPSIDQVNAITNLCRCGTYPRIRQAVLRAARLMKDVPEP